MIPAAILTGVAIPVLVVGLVLAGKSLKADLWGKRAKILSALRGRL